jgi:hypothetical protein
MPEGKYYLEELHVDGRIILKSILQKLYEKMWSGYIWGRIQKILEWTPGARTANGTGVCH